MSDQQIIDKSLIKKAKEASEIAPREYKKHQVKRGLRNSNGTGVVVGVTKISNVIGYEVIDGEKKATKGILEYRGISLSDLVHGQIKEGRFGYEEIVYLLLFGELPNASELNQFESLLNDLRVLPENFKENVILNQPSNNIMNYIQRIILGLYSTDENPDDTSFPALLEKGINILAKMPTMIAYSYTAQRHYYEGDSLIMHAPIYASTAENILHMVRPDSEYTEAEARMLDLLLMTHAEHGGGNNSSFTTNVISSSGTDIYSTLAAAVGSLKGVKHGGANLKAGQMLDEIYENVSDPNSEDEIDAYLEKILAGKAYDKSGLIYGMGHAVYTVSDPRAELLKAGAKEMIKGNPELAKWQDKFEFIQLVEERAVKLLKKKRGEDFEICANVDLYSGFIYEMLDIPETLYTPLFATARLAGWLAHILEQTSDGKIMRPAYATIPSELEYVSLKERK